MNHQSLAETICNLPFLDGAAHETCALLAGVAELQDIPAGTVLFREGQSAEAVFLVLSGEVALDIASADRGRIRFQTVGSGELLGWSPILGQPRMTATARALTAVQAVRFAAGPLLALCESQPRFGIELMRRVAIALAKRLAATRLQLLNVYGSELPGAAGGEGQA